MLFLICKIFLWILVVLLILILLILFVPIRYQLYAEAQEKNLRGRLRVKWFAGLIRLNMRYPEEKKLSLWLLWFQLNKEKSPKKDKAKKKTVKKNKSNENENAVPTNPDEGKELQPNPACNHSMEEEMKSGQPAYENTPQNSDDFLNAENQFDVEASSQKPKKHFLTKCKQAKEFLLHIIKEYSFYKELLQKPVYKELLTDVMKKIGKLLKKIAPKKIIADITFGTGACDTTGYCMALYGILYPFLPKTSKITITPDFENACLEGNLSIKGSITVFTILVQAIVLLTDKRIKKFISIIKNHAKENAVHNSTETE